MTRGSLKIVRLLFIGLLLTLFGISWAQAICEPADLNGDCRVDAEDLLILAGQW